MRFSQQIGALILGSILAACIARSGPQKFRKKDYPHATVPPGTVKIGPVLFYDQTEVTNLSYVEYLYWTKKVFGNQSQEYLTAFPDTSVWSTRDKCLLVNDHYYLRHPAYREYPVVGVSKAQAEKFAIWRSDRVFEFILIASRKIPFNSKQTSADYFSIDRYFEGKYSEYLPDTNFRYIPVYRLPSVSDYLLARHYADSLSKKTDSIYCDVTPCLRDTLRTDPTIYSSFPSKKLNPLYIYHLRGNVRELTSEPGVSVGGGWTDTKKLILSKDTFGFKKPDAFTGFRNVCEWKKWNRQPD